MILRLITTLQALAAPAETQLGRYPVFLVNAGEIALDFEDALMLIRDCPQIELTSEQQVALSAVDRSLEDISGSLRAELWTEMALRHSTEWQVVRRVATTALEALGAPVDDPAASDAIYLRAPRRET